MPRLKTETFGAGDQSWLRSTHGMRNAKTETIDNSAFDSGDNYPNGYIPSGTPVAKVSSKMVPYTSSESTTTGAGVLWGHLLTDQPVVGTVDFLAPVLRHGEVVAAKVPQGTDAFTAPVAAAKRASSTINYV
jgi:hypothetical protein